MTLDHNPNYFDLKGDNFEVTEKIRGSLHLSLLGHDVVMKGTLQTRVQMVCVRCLDTVDIPIARSFTMIYVHQKKREQAGLEFKEEEEDVSHFDGFVIVPDSDIRELILADLPDYPKCRDNCRGLCPQCGSNLNDGPCECRKSEKDFPPREKSWKDRLKQIHP